MKKFLLIAFVLFAPMMGFAKGVNLRNEITGLVQRFDNKREFEVIKMGKVAMSLMRTVADRDDKEAMRAIKDLQEMIVVEYDDCSRETKQAFDKSLSEVLSKASLVMEVNDDGDKVKVYGNVDENLVEDLIIYTPSECTLVCFFGTINLNDLDIVIDEFN